MCGRNREASQQVGEERSGKRIAGADRIDDIDLRRGQDRGLVTSHYDAVGVAGGQNRHVQIEHAGERLHHALSRGDVVPGRVKSEQVGHDGQLLVVDFEDGGALEESGDDFLVDESGADVDVEQADGVGARGVDHPVDGVAGAPRLAGGDGAVADRVGAAYEAAHLVGEFDVVPGDALDDVVFGDATVIQSDGGDAGGIVVDLRGHVAVVVGADGDHGWRGGIGHDGSWVETGFETGFGHSEPRPE